MEKPIVISYPGYYSLARHRKGLNGFYDPNKEAKESVKMWYRLAWKKAGYNKPIDSPIFCHIVFVKKSSRKKDVGNLWDTKPDIDNMIKFVFDTAEKAAEIITNDSRIALIKSEKLWGLNDRTNILLFPITDNSTNNSYNYFMEFDRIYFNRDNYSFQKRNSCES